MHPPPRRFCPYLGNAFLPVPTRPAPTANAGSLPLSPVTPLRPPRRQFADPSPSKSRAAPGSAAVNRAISEDLGPGPGTGPGTGASTPIRARQARAGAGGGGNAGVPQSTGMLSFVCFSLGGECLGVRSCMRACVCARVCGWVCGLTSFICVSYLVPRAEVCIFDGKMSRNESVIHTQIAQSHQTKTNSISE